MKKFVQAAEPANNRQIIAIKYVTTDIESGIARRNEADMAKVGMNEPKRGGF